MKEVNIQMTSKIKNGINILSIFILLVLWQLVAYFYDNRNILPAPFDVAKELIIILGTKYTYIIILSSVVRIIISFFIAFLFAGITGITAGLNQIVESILKPITSFMKSVPTMSLILIIIMYLNTSFAPIIICFSIVYPILYSSFLQGIKNVDIKLIEMAELYSVSNKKIITDIYLPAVKSYVFAGISSALGLNFKIMIASEVLGYTKNSLGKQLFISKINLEFSGIIAWTIIIILLVYVFDKLVDYIFSKHTYYIKT